ncbi:sulfite reductase [NADPH] flavoprotein alpha-component-like isoform X2 [Watersipora subatra]|uniref:sulfite reductase [NADPH] flavoprotein alpha-component-like isoform X2 n=1 Tax=Watersipora subatra TaxID=2589382 RepID=UPI00355B77BF
MGYVTITLTTSSGSELGGNSIDDYILNKDTPRIAKTNKKYNYCSQYADEKGCQLRIMFGTEYGAAEDISKSLYKRLLQSGAKKIVARHNVDMEDQNTIDQWMEKVLSAITVLNIDESIDYLPKSMESELAFKFHRNNPFMANILRKEILTESPNKEDRQTVHIEFDLTGSSLTWQSGDALGVYPCNSEPEVMDLLGYVNMSGQELVTVDSSRATGDPVELLDALMKHYNLKDISLPLLRYFESHLDDVQMSHYRGEVRDLFRLNPSIEIEPQQLVELLKPLQPRYYSISSSFLVDPSVACITVAVVRYNLLGTERTGVCSTYLYERCFAGDKVGIFLSQNADFRLPCDSSKDILMIGPGTGIAPFMSFISERIFSQAKGRMVLYFGCRHSEKDFLYKHQLEKWKAEGIIHLQCAFSRDQIDKVYVQDIILRQSKEIYKHIQGGGHLYVCGDASRMAHDVHEVLLEIIAREGGLDPIQAEHYLSEMAMTGRYQKDVWVTLTAAQ